MLATLDITRFTSLLASPVRPKRGPIWQRLVALSPHGVTAEIAFIYSKTGLFGVLRPIVISVVADLDSYAWSSQGESVNVSLVADGASFAKTRLTFDKNGIAPLDVQVGRDRIELDLDIYFSVRRTPECAA
jgi:hypothetical protein